MISKVLFQPASKEIAYKHYVDTIENPVEIGRFAQFVSKDFLETLKELYPERKVPTWGIKAGKKEVGKKKWNKIRTGDIVLFTREKYVILSATVTLKIHHTELAKNLWGVDKDGETWEYMYFIDELVKQHIPYETLNKVAPFGKGNNFMGFQVTVPEKSERILSYFDLKSEVYLPDPSEEDSGGIDPQKPLDKTGKTIVRVEQGALRKQLFGGRKFDKCGMCDQIYPIRFLIAAHIKKRAFCTNREKRDHKNIAMPMCSFGCDDLYEQGYFVVKDGKIVATNKPDRSPSIDKYLQSLEGKECSYWNEHTKKYFLWHYRVHSKDN